MLDWPKVEYTIYMESKEAIDKFSVEHFSSSCSFFAFACNLVNGLFNISFDTTENALRKARERELKVIERRKKILRNEPSWKAAVDHIELPRLVDHCSDVGYFSYHPVRRIQFKDWDQFTSSLNENYPLEADYVSNNIRIILWKVIEKLITENHFKKIKLASPFRLGYQLHDEELVVVRIINWPDVTA